MVQVAKRGRSHLRLQKGKITYTYVREEKNAKDKHRGAKELKAEDLASIANEFESGMLGNRKSFAGGDDDDPEGEGEGGDDEKDELEFEQDLARIQGDLSSDDEMVA